MSDVTLNLPPEFVDAVAERVAELLADRAIPAAPASPYMTVPEAAEYLRCKRQRVDDLLSSGRLTRHKDGSRTLVSRSEITAHVAS